MQGDIILIPNASDPNNLLEHLERELLNAGNWLETNQMTINTKKLRQFSSGVNHV